MTILWARWDEREDGTTALTLFRRVIVSTARGQALQDIPVLVVEDTKGTIGETGEAVELELDAHRDADGTIAVFAKAVGTTRMPKDPVLKRTKFDDPESDEAKKKKQKAARGMGRFLGEDKKSKPVSKGAVPPVPPEQRVGGKGRVTGRRKRGPGSKTTRRGGAVRGAARGGGKTS